MVEVVHKFETSRKYAYPTSRKNAEPISSTIEQDNSSDIDRLISAYYLQKSIEQDQSSLEFSEESFTGSADIVRHLMGAPSSTPRHVLLKLNIFENELTDEIENGSGIGSEALLLFAGIKRDVMNLLAARD